MIVHIQVVLVTKNKNNNFCFFSIIYLPAIFCNVIHKLYGWGGETIIRLKISAARVSDSGNYTCMPTAAESASVIVHVINGK